MTAATADDLTRPLGGARRSASARRAPPARTIVGVLAGMMTVLAAAQIWIGQRPDESGVATIKRRTEKPAELAAAPAATAKPAAPAAGDKPVMSAQDMESASGVVVVRGGGAGAPESLVIQVQPSEQAKIAAPDRKLLERARHGALPRIAADGARPSQFYARPVGDLPAGKPRMAILVGGMGVSQSATADAIAKLPGPISLAFAPYGGDLERQAQRARGEGHEIFLQAPMEPFDYPENDPGPHTLRVGASDGENVDKLQWVMSRIQGYVGVVNFMGAKFSAQETALRPVVKEIAERGLMLIDDGSSNRSQLAPVAASLKAPSARADLVIDATPRGDAIDRELAKLEAIARDKGVAIGFASALPATVERLARWSRALEAKGVILVPVSYAATARRGAAGP